MVARTPLLLMFCCIWYINLVSPTIFDQERPALRSRGKRQLPFDFIRIVSFPNNPCLAIGATQGTCYTSEECLARGGTNSGRCASGFGVCCIFTMGCGGVRAENCTYFDASGVGPGACAATICPMDSNICQLRLDFDSFSIAGPSTETSPSFTQINGQPTVGGAPVGFSSRCLVDTFSVGSPGSSGPPLICGTNTGEHMYVESSAACTALTFQIGAATSVSRSWSIKVTQYDCNYDNLAPTSCTQYFFGSNSGTVTTYNYQSGSGRHLANQNQAQCVRRERGNCRLCVFATDTTDFMVSGPTEMGTVPVALAATMCCQYGNNGQGVIGYDCLVIPAARPMSTPAAAHVSRFCGNRFPGTQCTTAQPFLLRFLSDGFEGSGPTLFFNLAYSVSHMPEASGSGAGYRLAYSMDAIDC